MLTQTQTPTTQYLSRPAGRIAYEDTAGTGPLVIALPSLGDVRQEYRFLTPQLVAAGYRVVTMDLRGLGESSTGWDNYGAEAVGADVLALVAALDAGPALLIGCSMAGGAIAWAAAERPELVAGLVLIDPFARNVPGPAWQAPLFRLLLMRPWGPAAWARYYRSLYPTQPPADLDAYVSALTANLRQPGRMEATQGMSFASKAGVEARLGAVQAPALVVMGTKDPDFKDPAGEARLIAERLHATVRLIDGAGHYPHAEMPAQTGPAVLAFLQQVRPVAGVSHGR